MLTTSSSFMDTVRNAVRVPGDKMTSNRSTKIIPLILTIVTVAVDQLTKLLVVSFIPVGGTAASFFDGFLGIVHHRNLGAAFSMGTNLNDMLRVVFFTVLPVVVFGIFLYYYFRTEDFTTLQRYAFTGVLGGGIGNIIDRIFRPDGVVDFISVRFYGFLGMEYFPTFNVADSLIVVCGILLAFSLLQNEGAKSVDN